MKKLLAIAVLLLFVCTPCYSNPTLVPVVDAVNFSFEFIYQVNFSVNGTDGYACADNVTEEVADLLCSTMGPFSGAIASISQNDYILGPSLTTSYANLTCSDGVQSCSAMEVSNCSDNGGLLFVQCTLDNIKPPSCYPGQIQIVNNVTSSGSLSGYPTACVNGTFTPICASAEFGLAELLTICVQFNFLSGYVGTPTNMTLPPLTNISDSVLVVTDYSCSTQCISTTATGPCDSMGYATVTCHNDTGQPSSCGESGVSFLNSTRTVSGGQETVTGIPLLCAGDGGPYSVLCNESTRAQEVSSLLCDFLGFETGSLLPPNPALYGMVPQGSFYVTNFSCPSNVTADEIVDCDATPIFDSQCQDGSLDVVVQCSRPYTSTSTVTPAVSSTASIRVTPTMDTNGTSSSSNIGPIVGGVIGGVLVVAIIVVVVVIVVILLVAVKNKKKTVSPLETGGKKEAVELSKYKDVKA